MMIKDIPVIATRADGVSVYFEKTRYEADNANLVYAKLIAEGDQGDEVTVSYKTSSGTGIENIDYAGASNTITLKIPASRKAEYTVSIKCLNDANNREKLRIYEVNSLYGRYFNLKITSVSAGASIGTNSSCKCYLPYNYKVEGMSSTNSTTGRITAYLKDEYKMQSLFNSGIDDLDGKSTWKTWKKGMSFNNETSQRWINAFINQNIADAYASFLVKSIDDSTWQSSTDIHVLAGNKQFTENYERSKDCPGLYLYFTVDPDKKGGYRCDYNAMKYISNDKNPTKEEDRLVNVSNRYKIGEHKNICWITDKDTWYASNNSVVESAFYKIKPYNGILDQGIAFYNGNKEYDREIDDVWMFLYLYDSTAPKIVNKYAEFDDETQQMRFYVRFNEPVYSAKTGSAKIKINDLVTDYWATYTEGNFSDTLVYSLPLDTFAARIDKVGIQLPTDQDIGDMAYHLSSDRRVSCNYYSKTTSDPDFDPLSITSGYVDLSRPNLAADISDSGGKPRNLYNIVLSANNGTTFTEGVVHYTWSKQEDIGDENDVQLYNHHHTLRDEEMGSFTVTLAKDASEGIDGGDYYLHALAVSNHGFSRPARFGPYRLDGDAPVIEKLTPEVSEPNGLKTKTYKIKVNNKELGTDMKNISLQFKYSDPLGAKKTATLDLMKDGVRRAGVDADESDPTAVVYKYISNIDSTPAVVDLYGLDTEFIPGLMDGRSRMSAEVTYIVEDEAGNKASTEPTYLVYDIRELFEVDVDTPDNYDPVVDARFSDVEDDVYNITSPSDTKGLTFTVTEDDIKDSIADGAKLSVVLNDKTVIEAPDLAYSVTLAGLEPGHYDAVCRVSGHTSGGDVDMVSKTYSFYLTDNFTDSTVNKENTEGNLVLTNHVFTLSSSKYYYYNASKTMVSNHLYGATLNPSTDRYDGGSANPTFSSSVEAKKYVRFMEYQDLYLLRVTETIASFLNGGSGSTIYVKANGETKTAQEGQLWVRYKRNTWTTTSEASGWAFYYYSNGNLEDGININALSPNLNSAMDAVVNRIVSAGEDTYLVREEDLNSKTGAPHLNEAQMHVYEETASVSKSGTNYVTNPTYAGDPKLYVNNVEVDDVEYPLATNMPITFDPSSVVYYQYAEGDWNRLRFEDGQTFRNVLTSPGIYHIREFGEGGVSDYSFYLDPKLPLINATMNKGIAGSEQDIVINQNVDDNTDRNITCKNIVFNSMEDIDPYAYVAIYSYPNNVLQKVLYKEDIANYMISDGNYYVQIGDRSGNVITYVVQTSSSDLTLSVEENESKTAVFVNTNRDESEIYSFEVYLNEVLIDNEYASRKVYRESGCYRVEVTDIYGNSVYETLVHSSPSPDITWYYLNDNGGYSIYDENKPVKMILKDDPSGARTTNVYTSTHVRLLFTNNSYNDSPVRFELTGIDSSEYYYNETTGLLSINSLSSWSLRVWFEDAPDNDHYYVCQIDNTPPDISTSFVGTAFYQYYEMDGDKVIETSSFDVMDFSKYQVGDVLTVDTLRYVTNNSTTLTFDNGSVICGSHIVITISDPSGVSSNYSVMKNGQQIQVAMDKNQLLLMDYGSYVITVSDALGNTTVFTFINVKDSTSIGTIDGNIIEEDTLIYGHDDLTITSLYSGAETILVKAENQTYTYEFNFDGTTLTYGQYFYRQDKYEDEESVIHNIDYAAYQVATGFALNINEVKRDNWYPVITHSKFIIYAMINENGLACYRVTPTGDDPVYTETYLYVGNNKVPSRFIAELSKDSPDITLVSGEKEVIQTPGLNYIYIADDLTIKAASIDSSITKIEYAYNQKSADFDDFKVIYDGELSEFKGTENGFYQIVVTNKYNNKTTYTLYKITAYGSVVNCYFLDGNQVTFYQNEGTIRANQSIELMVYSENVTFIVNGDTTTGVVEDGMTFLEITREGTYHVEVIGANGIREDFNFEIKQDESFLYDEEWITGYNTEALLADQSYTNTLCSVELDDDVVFIDMLVNDEIYVKLYDDVTEDKLNDPELLKEIIGSYGVGKYEISFRNQYGDLVKKTVHFNDVPSLTLQRITTTNSGTVEDYDLEFAIEKDFYSNYIMIFSTDSTHYIFKINGDEYRLDEPKQIGFTNISGTGSLPPYEIEYLDEYGNHIYFTAILYREEVEIDTTAMNTILVGDTLYTKDDVKITFGEGLKATYSVDGGQEKEYFSGDTYYADGTYTFTVRDIAGNRTFYTVVHKSVNHYTINNTSTGEEVMMGGVVNDGSVSFHPTDGSSIILAFRNGELLGEINSNTFSVTGHYEILIEDVIGNRSYEEFYIINNELCKFDYSAPYGYTVTEVWRIKPDGARELTNIKGDSISLSEDGNYVVVVTGKETTTTYNFTIGISNVKPTATLVGVEDNGVTAKDVTFTGLRSGDVVKIYRDGVLISTTTITLSSDYPTIDVGGKYRVVITNVQGVEVEYNFTRKVVTNTAGSVFIMIACGLAITGIGIGLLYHTKLKTDD